MGISKILDEKARTAIFTDNWPIRRRWMKWSLFFMAGNIEALIAWTIYTGGGAYGVQIVMALLTAAVSILMFYIFGAVWDDHSKRRFMGGFGRRETEDSDGDEEGGDAASNPLKAERE
jgi:uncharacterized membrane protein